MSVLPCLIQSSSEPLIHTEHDTDCDLTCSQCGKSVLVRNYHPENFVRVRMRCFVCGAITETPSLPSGEIFPNRVVTLGDGGDYRIDRSLRLPRQVIVTCDPELEREQHSVRPRPPTSEPLPLSESSLLTIESRYSELIGSELWAKQLGAIKRGRSPDTAREYPFVWACTHLRKQISRGELRLDSPESLFALRCLMTFRRFVDVWGHHPRFAIIAATFRGRASFHHNIAQFATASYLFEHGNAVGLGLPSGQVGEKSADLYVRTTAAHRLHLEVKASQALHWPAPMPDAHAVERAVLKALKDSRGQINRKNPGVLVVAAAPHGAGFFPQFAQVIAKTLRTKGRDHRGLAAVVGLLASAHVSVGAGELDVHQEYTFQPVPNPSYEGEIGLSLN